MAAGVVAIPLIVPERSSVWPSVCRVLKLRLTLNYLLFWSSLSPFAFSTRLSISWSLERGLYFAAVSRFSYYLLKMGCGITWCIL